MSLISAAYSTKKYLLQCADIMHKWVRNLMVENPVPNFPSKFLPKSNPYSSPPSYLASVVEEWMPVVGYEGIYKVSNFGEVVRLETTTNRSGPTGRCSYPERIRRPHLTPKGYLRVRLQRDGVGKNYFVHQLVANAFIPNLDNKPMVNHKNGIKTDNFVDNLEWATNSENVLHAYDNGLNESNVKYLIYCNELDVSAVGTVGMAKMLQQMGYDRATSAGVWSAAIGTNNNHLDLTFDYISIDDYPNVGPFDRLNLMQLILVVCEWIAISEATPGGDVIKSIKINQARFGYDDQTKHLLINTARSILSGDFYGG